MTRPRRSPIPLVRPATGERRPELSNSHLDRLLDEEDVERELRQRGERDRSALTTSAARQLCARFGSAYDPPGAQLKCGIALSTLDGRQPLNALRLRPEESTSGWFIWAGEELSDDADFFQSLHLEHLPKYCPKIISYLALEPGYRVLLAPNYEDVWFDLDLFST